MVIVYRSSTTATNVRLSEKSCKATIKQKKKIILRTKRNGKWGQSLERLFHLFGAIRYKLIQPLKCDDSFCFIYIWYFCNIWCNALSIETHSRRKIKCGVLIRGLLWFSHTYFVRRFFLFFSLFFSIRGISLMTGKQYDLFYFSLYLSTNKYHNIIEDVNVQCLDVTVYVWIGGIGYSGDTWLRREWDTSRSSTY